MLSKSSMGSHNPGTGGGLSVGWQEGDEVLGGEVVRRLQALEDSELYLVRRGTGPFSVVKIERASQQGLEAPVRAQLEREGVALRLLQGRVAPRLYESGELDGRTYIDIEYLAGVDADAEATRLREIGGEASLTALLSLGVKVARAYAMLHAKGVLHGNVHPRNVLIDRAGEVRIVDFGFAAAIGSRPSTRPDMRGGVPFFLEPELSRNHRTKGDGVRASAAGEQYAVAALIYHLLTGVDTSDYSLGLEEMLREIAELAPFSFAERGLVRWAVLKSVLERALSKDPRDRYPGLDDFAAALSSVNLDDGVGPSPSARTLAEFADRCIVAADVGGAWEQLPSLPAPSASINYGAAGLAVGLLRISQSRDDPRLVALARHWLQRAEQVGRESDGFYNPSIDITPETVGAASPYYTPAGIHAAQALLARSIGDLETQAEATAAFIAASGSGHNGLDLTWGKTSSLLGAAILLDALPDAPTMNRASLVGEGNRLMHDIWNELDRLPEIGAGIIEYPGMAHGWAGFIYGALIWSATAGTPVPFGLERRLDELAALARPVGRGVTWPWALVGQGRYSTRPGWWNGSSGYVFLWTLAARLAGQKEYTDLAIGAAWDTWDAPDLALSLCSGLAGRAYALLNVYRATGEAVWLERARTLALRGVVRGTPPADNAHSLWNGDLGLAVLTADLEKPDRARMPFFETVGWSGRTV
jgi:serine/threonine protein kinase